MQLRRVHLGTGIIIWHCQNLDFQVSNDETTVLYNFNCSVENGSHTITRSQNTPRRVTKDANTQTKTLIPFLN